MQQFCIPAKAPPQPHVLNDPGEGTWKWPECHCLSLDNAHLGKVSEEPLTGNNVLHCWSVGMVNNGPVVGNNYLY